MDCCAALRFAEIEGESKRGGRFWGLGFSFGLGDYQRTKHRWKLELDHYIHKYRGRATPLDWVVQPPLQPFRGGAAPAPAPPQHASASIDFTK